MKPWDDRGQSIQIGAVLVFAAVVVLLAIYQASVVPQQNERVEFDHSQQVRGDLLDLRNAVVSTIGDSSQRSVAVTLGTTYPSRVLAVNPPPVSGQLRTIGTTNGDVSFGVVNATALDTETDDFWNGTRRDFDTGGVVYRPNYNEYGQPPLTGYEHSVVYDEFSFEGTTIARSGQALIDGNAISLVALNGSLRESSSGTASVDVRPVTASSTTVAVRNAAPDSNVTIRVSTRLSESRWGELLAGEFVAAGGNVTDVRTNPIPTVPEYRMLVIDLVPGTYDLRLAKAGVGTRVTGTEAAYMTGVRVNRTAVAEEGSALLTVEVRDAYNNPVSGVTVAGATAEPAVGTLKSNTATTDRNGRATFHLETESVEAERTLPINFSYAVDPVSVDAFDADQPENVGITVEVQNNRGSSGSSGSGSAPYALQWMSPSGDFTFDSGANKGTQSLRALLEDVDTTLSKRTVEGARVDFAVNNSTVASVSPHTSTTDNRGQASTTMSANANGTVRIYAVSGSAGDLINVTVTNVTTSESGGGGMGEFSARIDDLTAVDRSRPEYIVSFDARDVSDADRVRTIFDNDDGAAQTQTSTSGDLRGHARMAESTDDFTYNLSIEVLDSDGTVLTQKVISDTADAQNPPGNDDLSQTGSPALVAPQTSINDDSGSSGIVRYRYSYEVATTGDFDKVMLFALSHENNGDSGLREQTGASGQNMEITFSYGIGNEYRVGFLVFDSEGAVVDVIQNSGTETADGSGAIPLTSGLAFFLVFSIRDGHGRSDR